MAVVSGGITGAAGPCNDLPLGNIIAYRNIQAGIVAIQGLDAVSVVNDDRLAVSVVPTGHNDSARRRRHNGGAVGTSNVNGLVPGAVAAADVSVARDRP